MCRVPGVLAAVFTTTLAAPAADIPTLIRQIKAVGPEGAGSAAAAKAELRKLLSAARDGGQEEEIARELERRGESVDYVAHFGFITRWQVAGVFDNSDEQGFQTSFPPERGVDLRATLIGKGGAAV